MDKKYSAMTVNERLYESGLIKAWDKATLKRDIQKMKEILGKVELGEQADKIIAAQFKQLGYQSE